ncbi:MAG: sulfite exporter TauE/SafE family protein [Gemmatimonadota bacterium]|nr:sulfite exporter TauE/SafE family protein [Gemmatimonadota bacterium]
MSDVPTLVLTAIALGALHSFAPDHLAAVGLFVSRAPSWRRALALGVRWGIGHSATIVLLGAALAWSGVQVPPHFETAMERLVGATLVVLGAVALGRAYRVHGHWHTHDGATHAHLHAHHRGPSHDHDHRALLGVGALHGFAGAGALVVLIPVTTSASPRHSLIFLAAFGLGTVLSMSLFGAAAGWLIASASRAWAVAARSAAALGGAGSVAVGLWWLMAGGMT